MTKRKAAYPHELIGELIEIIGSKNKFDVGTKGKIVDETKFTLIIESEEKTKRFFKNNIVFKIIKADLIIVGREITKRPEERLKG